MPSLHAIQHGKDIRSEVKAGMQLQGLLALFLGLRITAAFIRSPRPA